MKKMMVVLTLFLMFFSFQKTASATIGVGIIVGEPTGLSVKVSKFPVLGVSWSFQNYFYGSCDYWIIERPLAGPVNWFLGVGAKGLFSASKKNEDTFRLGARVPVGLQWYPIKRLELFGEIVPCLVIVPSIGFDLNGGIGVRYHF